MCTLCLGWCVCVCVCVGTRAVAHKYVLFKLNKLKTPWNGGLAFVRNSHVLFGDGTTGGGGGGGGGAAAVRANG